MALANRIQVTTATTGTGTLTLSGTGVRSGTIGDCLSPAEVGVELANRRIPYFITSSNSFAYGMGTLDPTGLTLTRDAFERSWNGTTYGLGLLTLAGTSTVLINERAEDLQAASIGVSTAVRMCAILL